MKVTDITPQKNNNHRFSVFVDNKYAFSLDKTDVLFEKIRIGTPLTQKDIERYTQDGEFTRARDYALKILSQKPITKNALCESLAKKGFCEAVIFEAAKELEDLGYLDDKDYATLFLEHSRQKLWGKKKTEYEMRQKGLGDSVIKEVLEDYDEQSLADDMIKLIFAKYRGEDISDYKTRAKITRYFAARGFGYSTIDAVIRAAKEEKDNE